MKNEKEILKIRQRVDRALFDIENNNTKNAQINLEDALSRLFKIKV
jgi:hypothetical protein